MKNIKIDDKTNDFLVKYAAVVGLSKRVFLGKLLENISPYELQKIFGRVLLNFGGEEDEFPADDGENEEFILDEEGVIFEDEDIDEEVGIIDGDNDEELEFGPDDEGETFCITLKSGKVIEYEKAEIFYDEQTGKHIMGDNGIIVYFDEDYNPVNFSRGEKGQLRNLNKDGYQV